MPQPGRIRVCLALAIAGAGLASCAAQGGGAAPSIAEPAPDATAYERDALSELSRRVRHRADDKPAKNVIVFVGDGMSPTFLTAARIYDGQLRGEQGEENYLAFERFLNLALVKTYSANGQMPDSAATATALWTGVKADNGAVGVYAAAGPDDCAQSADVPDNMANLAERLGKSAGVVTTSSVLDATPAAFFAHAPSRAWAISSRVPETARQKGCQDIAEQLLESSVDVALGGGRRFFLPESAPDPEEGSGVRHDRADLIAEWGGRDGVAYVWNAEELSNIGDPQRLLGLFANDEMFAEEGETQNPTLAEMTEAAIDVLSRNEEGFVLLVEHEGTDELQHAGLIRRALDSAIELNEAVKRALEMTDPEETLVIVTADHGQGLAFSGFAPKGNPILGLGRTADGELHLAADGKPYTTLGFHIGPPAEPTVPRADLTNVDTADPAFIPQSAVPSGYVSHSGDDVALYATGPGAHLFRGLLDQPAVFYFIRHAMTAEGVE